MTTRLKCDQEFTIEEVKANRKKWISALRSGKFKQTRGKLSRGSKTGGTEYCCLGVFAHLFPGAGTQNSDLNDIGRKALGMSNSAMARAIELNDENRYSFKEIATYFSKLWKL